MRKQNIDSLSDNQIKDLILAMQKGVDVLKEDSEEYAILKKNIDRALEELNHRKKNDSGKAPTIEPTPPLRNAPGSARQEEGLTVKVEKEKNVNPVLLEGVLTKVPAPTIPVRWASGEVKQMTAAELERKAKDYFRDVLNSKFDESNFNRSTQFNNCVRFLIGLYRFGNDLLPHLALHPTFNYCSEETKTKSIELYKQIREGWEKYKDISV